MEFKKSLFAYLWLKAAASRANVSDFLYVYLLDLAEVVHEIWPSVDEI
jgi:hypothetical protein